MSVVYVQDNGAVIRKNGDQLKVTLGEKILFTIPLVNLEQLIIMGGAQLTTQAAVLLLRKKIDVVFMSSYGKYQGRLITNESRQAELRHKQLRLCDDEEKSIQIATRIVAGKIMNQRVILQRRSQHSEQIEQSLKGMMGMLDSSLTVQNLDQLRGYEGKAAAYYFNAIRHFFPVEWGFKTRAYYPPPDPANALLSFTYTLLLKDVEAKIQVVGLDSYLGFFHTLGYNRPGLALDLMEEFRPSIADVVVLELIREKHITVEDFEWTNQPQLPVRMTKRAVDVLVRFYEERLQDTIYHPLANGQITYRSAIEYQARQIARVIRGDDLSYEPLVMR